MAADNGARLQQLPPTAAPVPRVSGNWGEKPRGALQTRYLTWLVSFSERLDLNVHCATLKLYPSVGDGRTDTRGRVSTRNAGAEAIFRCHGVPQREKCTAVEIELLLRTVSILCDHLLSSPILLIHLCGAKNAPKCSG